MIALGNTLLRSINSLFLLNRSINGILNTMDTDYIQIYLIYHKFTKLPRLKCFVLSIVQCGLRTKIVQKLKKEKLFGPMFIHGGIVL